MSKKGHSERGLFGTIKHYDEHGKKIVRAVPDCSVDITITTPTAGKQVIVHPDCLVDTITMITTERKPDTVSRNSSVAIDTMMIKTKMQDQAILHSLVDSSTKNK